MPKMMECESCHQPKPATVAAVVGGHYYRNVCSGCLGGVSEQPSSGAQSYERRRGYEDNAQDTVQPYDAMGRPRSEFYRLYPQAAQKVFTAREIEDVKRKI